FFFQAEDGIRDRNVTGVQTCALPIYPHTAVAAVHAQLGEVVAAAHRAQLLACLLLPLLHRLRQCGEALPELLEPGSCPQARELARRQRLLMSREAHGDRRLDGGAPRA